MISWIWMNYHWIRMNYHIVFFYLMSVIVCILLIFYRHKYTTRDLVEYWLIWVVLLILSLCLLHSKRAHSIYYIFYFLLIWELGLVFIVQRHLPQSFVKKFVVVLLFLILLILAIIISLYFFNKIYFWVYRYYYF